MRTLPQRVALLVALAALGARADELAELDRVAPAFRLPVYNAKEVGFSAAGVDRYAGPEAIEKGTRVLLVSFMASFCAPCKKELPALEALHRRYRKDGLRVLSIAIDGEPEGQKKIDELIAQHQVTFPVLKDRFSIVARRWLGPRSPLPSLFVLRADGTVKAVHRGYSQDGVALLEAEVATALQEP